MEKIRIIQRAVIKKGGKVLIIKRAERDNWKSGFWDIPGGGVNPNEDYISAIKREVLEEVNLNIDLIKPLYTWEVYRGDGHYAIGISYLSKFLIGEVSLSEEHSEYKWVSPKEINKFKFVDGVRESIVKSF